MGALGSLNYFSLEKFVEDCIREREARKIWLNMRHDFAVPLYVPEDRQVLKGIREIAQKGAPKNSDHTLQNVDAFNNWRMKLAWAAEKKEYFPELKNTISQQITRVQRTSKEERATQLQETFFVNE